MQTAFNFLDINAGKEKATIQNTFVITPRDLEVLCFVCEMKFASLEDLYSKFFKVLRSGQESKSNWYARERIMQLVKHNFLSRVFSFSERTSYFVGTSKAYLSILKQCPERIPTRPLSRIDQNTFHHDKTLIKVRLQLESLGVVKSWISDRQLFQYPELCLNFGEGNQPDAIYVNQEGERVALELEMTRKSKRRYTDKVRNYAYLLREQKNNPVGFKKVHYIVGSEALRDLIFDEVKIYPNQFSIQMLNDLLPASLNLKGESL